MEREGLKRIGDLLPGAARRAGMDGDPVAAGVVFREWRAIVGPHIADHAEPTSLRRGVLRVRADSPAWAAEIGYLGEQIRAGVNGAAGSDLVVEVRVWTAPGPIARTDGAGGARKRRPGAGERPPEEDPEAGLHRARRAWWNRRRTAGENQ